MNFIIAMHNALRTAAYETPARAAAPVPEYLIVQRPDAETLTISDAGRAPTDKPDKAPDALAANNTQVGTLIRQDQDAGTETFILNRFLPRGLVLPQGEKFFPADGFIMLGSQDGRPTVSVSGRHAHAREIAGGRFVAIDFPGEPTSSASAFTWHFEATYLPWVHETLPN